MASANTIVGRQSTRRAAAAIAAQEAELRPSHRLDTEAERIAGLLADLMHYAAARGVDFNACVAHARNEFDWELGRLDF